MEDWANARGRPRQGIEFCVARGEEGESVAEASGIVSTDVQKPPALPLGAGTWVGPPPLSKRGAEWQRACGDGEREVGEIHLFQISSNGR